MGFLKPSRKQHTLCSLMRRYTYIHIHSSNFMIVYGEYCSLAGRYVGMLDMCPHRKYRKMLCVSFAINVVQ